MKIEKYARKIVFVDAIQLTKENLKEVSNWIGNVEECAISILMGGSFIRFGEYIIKERGKIKVYREDYFLNNFKRIL